MVAEENIFDGLIGLALRHRDQGRDFSKSVRQNRGRDWQDHIAFPLVRLEFCRIQQLRPEKCGLMGFYTKTENKGISTWKLPGQQCQASQRVYAARLSSLLCENPLMKLVAADTAAAAVKIARLSPLRTLSQEAKRCEEVGVVEAGGARDAKFGNFGRPRGQAIRGQAIPCSQRSTRNGLFLPPTCPANRGHLKP